MKNVVIYINPAGVKAFGKNAPEVIRRDILSLFSRKNAEMVSRAIDSAKKGGHEHLNIEEGESFFKATFSPITGDDNRAIGFVMGLLDMTREKKLEQSRMDVSARFMNDIRDPLRAIQDSLQEIKGTKCGRECSKLLEHVEDEIRSADKMVEELFTVIWPSPEKVVGKMKECDIGRALRMAIHSMEPIFKRTGVGVENLLPKELPTVVCNNEKMGQALINLLSYSARKISAKAGEGMMSKDKTLIVSGKHIKQSDGKENVLVTISSSGFERSDAEEELELVTIRKIVEVHSGVFKVVGEEGMGTTYSILLPVYSKYR